MPKRWQRPDLFDPQFGRKLDRLRARLAGVSARDLWLVMGSSLVMNGVQPDKLARGGPRFFNFSTLGGGDPVTELVYTYRLLHRGIHPGGMLIELNPVGLARSNGWIADMGAGMPRMGLADLPVIAPYLERPVPSMARWVGSRIAAIFTYRFLMLRELGWAWFGGPASQLPELDNIDGWGFQPLVGAPGADQPRLDPWSRLMVESEFPRWAPVLEAWRISQPADRALRELIGLCGRESIPAAIIVMPESGAVQSLYGPGARQRLDAYLEELTSAHSIPWIDSRDWASDEDFAEGIHLTATGAARFSERLGREALPELVKGTLPMQPAKTKVRRTPFPPTDDNHAPSRSVRVKFDRALPGYGWSTPTRAGAWTSGTAATLNLWLLPDADYRIRLRIAKALSPQLLESLRLTVNGQPIALASERAEIGGAVFCAEVPEPVVTRDADLTRLVFRTQPIESPEGMGGIGQRGLLFDWLDIQRVSEVGPCAGVPTSR